MDRLILQALSDAEIQALDMLADGESLRVDRLCYRFERGGSGLLMYGTDDVNEYLIDFWSTIY